MATSYYDIGTITLTNGSKSVVGNGTGWQMALITGGNIFVEAPGNPLPIASVESDSEITAELAWTGASGTYDYRLQRDSAYMKALDENSRNLSYLLSEIRNGTLYKYDAAGDFANRAMFDGRPKGFGYLVTIGVNDPAFYVKASAAEGDWSGPFAYGTGPVGPQGPIGTLNPRGTYSAGADYVANDSVLYNGSSFVALQATTGNAPPTLPATENAYWSLLAVKGQDGAGTGDVVGPASSGNGRIAVFDGVTGKLLKDGGKLLSSIFARDNALGTVSQSGGIPTGALVENGSNANGLFVRFADGTQLCWYDGNYGITAAAGGVMTSTWSFPAAFASVPLPILSLRSVSLTDSFDLNYCYLSPSSTAATLKFVASVSQQYRFSLGAIGRWF